MNRKSCRKASRRAFEVVSRPFEDSGVTRDVCQSLSGSQPLSAISCFIICRRNIALIYFEGKKVDF